MRAYLVLIIYFLVSPALLAAQTCVSTGSGAQYTSLIPPATAGGNWTLQFNLDFSYQTNYGANPDTNFKIQMVPNPSSACLSGAIATCAPLIDLGVFSNQQVINSQAGSATVSFDSTLLPPTSFTAALLIDPVVNRSPSCNLNLPLLIDGGPPLYSTAVYSNPDPIFLRPETDLAETYTTNAGDGTTPNPWSRDIDVVLSPRAPLDTFFYRYLTFRSNTASDIVQNIKLVVEDEFEQVYDFNNFVAYRTSPTSNQFTVDLSENGISGVGTYYQDAFFYIRAALDIPITSNFQIDFLRPLVYDLDFGGPVLVSFDTDLLSSGEHIKIEAFAGSGADPYSDPPAGVLQFLNNDPTYSADGSAAPCQPRPGRMTCVVNVQQLIQSNSLKGEYTLTIEILNFDGSDPFAPSAVSHQTRYPLNMIVERGSEQFNNIYIIGGQAAAGQGAAGNINNTINAAPCKVPYDFNEDCMADYIVHTDLNPDLTQSFLIATEKGFVNDYLLNGYTPIPDPQGNVYNWPEGRAVVGYFDGGNMMDFALQYKFIKGYYVWFTRSTEFNSIDAFIWGSTRYKSLIADFNGDGTDDIAAVRDGRWFVRLANGAGAPLRFNLPTSDRKLLSGDINGNGFADAVVYRASDDQWLICLDPFLNAGCGNGNVRGVTYGSPQVDDIPFVANIETNVDMRFPNRTQVGFIKRAAAAGDRNELHYFTGAIEALAPAPTVSNLFLLPTFLKIKPFNVDPGYDVSQMIIADFTGDGRADVSFAANSIDTTQLKLWQHKFSDGATGQVEYGFPGWLIPTGYLP